MRIALPSDKDSPRGGGGSSVEAARDGGGGDGGGHGEVVDGLGTQVGEEGHVAHRVVHYVHHHALLAGVGRGRAPPVPPAQVQRVSVDRGGGGEVRAGWTTPLHLKRCSIRMFFLWKIDYV